MIDVFLFLLVSFSIIMITFFIRRKTIKKYYLNKYNSYIEVPIYTETKASRVKAEFVNVHKKEIVENDFVEQIELDEDYVDEEELRRVLNEPINWDDYVPPKASVAPTIKKEKESLNEKWKGLKENEEPAKGKAKKEATHSSSWAVIILMILTVFLIMRLAKCAL